MSAIELYKKLADGKMEACGIFFCSNCRIVHPSKDRAEWCHGDRRCACGKKVTQGYFQRKCSECDGKEWRAKEDAKEAERFEKATKIAEADYTGDHVMCGDKFYDSVMDAIDQYDEGQEPEYVWACKTHGIPTLDLESTLCNVVENLWEDADTSDLNGVEELEAAINSFNKANESIQMWDEDYSTAILVEKKGNG